MSEEQHQELETHENGPRVISATNGPEQGIWPCEKLTSWKSQFYRLVNPKSKNLTYWGASEEIVALRKQIVDIRANITQTAIMTWLLNNAIVNLERIQSDHSQD